MIRVMYLGQILEGIYFSNTSYTKKEPYKILKLKISYTLEEYLDD